MDSVLVVELSVNERSYMRIDSKRHIVTTVAYGVGTFLSLSGPLLHVDMNLIVPDYVFYINLPKTLSGPVCASVCVPTPLD